LSNWRCIFIGRYIFEVFSGLNKLETRNCIVECCIRAHRLLFPFILCWVIQQAIFDTFRGSFNSHLIRRAQDIQQLLLVILISDMGYTSLNTIEDDLNFYMFVGFCIAMTYLIDIAFTTVEPLNRLKEIRFAMIVLANQD